MKTTLPAHLVEAAHPRREGLDERHIRGEERGEPVERRRRPVAAEALDELGGGLHGGASALALRPQPSSSRKGAAAPTSRRPPCRLRGGKELRECAADDLLKSVGQDPQVFPEELVTASSTRPCLMPALRRHSCLSARCRVNARLSGRARSVGPAHSPR